MSSTFSTLVRKGRKLLRDPGAFVRDARTNRATARSGSAPADARPMKVAPPAPVNRPVPARKPPTGDAYKGIEAKVASRMPSLWPRIVQSPRFRLPFEEAPDSPVLIGGRSATWADGLAACQRRGLAPIGFLDTHARFDADTHEGLPVFVADQRPPGEHILLFTGAPKKSDFYASPPSPQQCYWLDDEASWRRFPKQQLKRIERHAAQYEQLHQLLADEESQLTLASILRTRIEGDSGYFRIAPYREYAHPKALPGEGDVVIDGGAFDGDSSIQLGSLVGNRGQVYAFEPSAQNYVKLCKRCAKWHNILPVAMGLSSKFTTMQFSDGAGGSSSISESGGSTVVVTSVDSFVKRARPAKIDLIKLDVEGAEIETLNGARHTLETQRPALHISVYHRPDDLHEIPLLLQEWLPSYRFWLGHHNFYHTETDLYAMPEERLSPTPSKP